MLSSFIKKFLWVWNNREKRYNSITLHYFKSFFLRSLTVSWWSPLSLKNLLLVKLFLLYSLVLRKKIRDTTGVRRCEIFLPRALKENVLEMLGSKIICSIPFFVSIISAMFYVISWFMFLSLYFCLPFLLSALALH